MHVQGRLADEAEEGYDPKTAKPAAWNDWSGARFCEWTRTSLRVLRHHFGGCSVRGCAMPSGASPPSRDFYMHPPPSSHRCVLLSGGEGHPLAWKDEAGGEEVDVKIVKEEEETEEEAADGVRLAKKRWKAIKAKKRAARRAVTLIDHRTGRAHDLPPLPKRRTCHAMVVPMERAYWGCATAAKKN